MNIQFIQLLTITWEWRPPSAEQVNFNDYLLKQRLFRNKWFWFFPFAKWRKLMIEKKGTQKSKKISLARGWVGWQKFFHQKSNIFGSFSFFSFKNALCSYLHLEQRRREPCCCLPFLFLLLLWSFEMKWFSSLIFMKENVLVDLLYTML